MAAFLGLFVGMSSYYWLLKVFHIDEQVANTTGWAIGLATMFFAEAFESMIANLFKNRHSRLKRKIEDLQSENEELVKELKIEKKRLSKINFFSKEKEMDM